jgi:hypothetical protein
MNAINIQTPTFTIYKPGTNREQVDSLIHCFIERQTLDSAKLPAFITAKNGEVYQAVYDSRLPWDAEFEAIISFQKHNYGCFAVIRNSRENNND